MTAAKRFADKAIGYGIPGVEADGNDVLAVYETTKAAVERARQGGGPTLIELHTFRRKGHAEHDNQSYVKPGEIEEWAEKNDPLDRNIKTLTTEYGFAMDELTAIDAKVSAEVDAATDEAEKSPPPEPRDALKGIYAVPPEAEVLWYREGVRSAVDKNERAQGWGTYNG
jgi:pyruvate dehydrogenase E1 component alpha subunit/2-oxoisovalerate dehydrogenase E1 component alpha subunit